ncbi:MAG: hypothetical protein JNL97_07615 [Verrucomicrobiales bacterium]|nr:hypothetical protein [Verrucomicrobiales bacterium]
MKSLITPRIAAAFGLAAVALSSFAAERNGRDPMEASLVTVEITAKSYDYFQPWSKPTRSVRKHAVVVGDRELVTTAQNLADRTLVRVQKGGRGRWLNAEVKWLDYHANVAILSVADAGFWNGLRPVELADRVPKQDEYEILRWRDGNLEVRRAEFSKFTVSDGALSFAPRIHLELNTEINGLGWAEPVLADGKIVGFTTSKGGNVCTVTPAPFIRRIVEAHRSGKFPGLGFFDFVWQQGENPATLQYLKVPGEPRGAVVIDIPKNSKPDYVLKKWDVIIEIDGFPVDMEGDYEDPDYGHLMVEGLATHRHFAGDRIPMKIARDGKILDIEYVLPKADYSVDLLPMFTFDAEPEYLVAGGLVFQPLTQPFLRSWGEDWRRRAPFRLVYYNSASPTTEVPAMVVLSQILPDPLNVGYQEFRNLDVDKINGIPVRRLTDVKKALGEPKNGVHLVEFFRGDGLQRLLVDASSLAEATDRVLERYGIPSAEVFSASAAAAGSSTGN